MRKIILCLVLIIFVLPVFASAANYYVATSGNDNNAGTEAQPYKTIQRCANIAQAGDTCLVNPGNYDENVNAVNSGTANNYIAFEAIGNARIRSFTIISRSYIGIKGFEIANSPGRGIYLQSASHIEILNNKVHNTNEYCISTHNMPSDHLIVRDNVISWCQVLYGGQMEPGAAVYLFGNNHLVESNDISHTGDFVLVWGESNVIRNNRFHDASWADWPGTEVHMDGYQMWCESGRPRTNKILVENNIMIDTPSEHTHFSVIQDEGNACGHSGIIMRHNYVNNLGSYFVISDRYIDNVMLYHNTLVNTGVAYTPRLETAITFVHESGGAIINNLFYNAMGNGGTHYVTDDSAPLSAHHNLAYNSGCGSSCSWYVTLANEPNAILNRDPLFVTSNQPALQGSSPAVNAGGPLARVAAADSGSGITLIVDNAWMFQDGWAGVQKDWIAVGNAQNTVQISSINYDTNVITLANPITRFDGDPVYLYSDSSGRRVLYGNAPDIGAYEYSSSSPPPPVPTLGDVNNDGRVDISDLVIVVVDFGKRSGFVNAGSDTNNDGIVDIADLVFVARRFTG